MQKRGKEVQPLPSVSLAKQARELTVVCQCSQHRCLRSGGQCPLYTEPLLFRPKEPDVQVTLVMGRQQGGVRRGAVSRKERWGKPSSLEGPHRLASGAIWAALSCQGCTMSSTALLVHRSERLTTEIHFLTVLEPEVEDHGQDAWIPLEPLSLACRLSLPLPPCLHMVLPVYLFVFKASLVRTPGILD
jgi:hypothetical protein